MLKEVEDALQVLLSEYDTTVYENRFVVGGVLEHIIGAAMRAAEISVENVGARDPRIDLRLPSADGFSVKGSFTKGAAVRLINSLGESKNLAWSEATIFILGGKGIAYGDPDLLPNATSRTRDALLLRRQPLNALLASQPQYLVVCQVPLKATGSGKTKTASTAVARDILTRKQFRLLAPFAPVLQ